jgi:hypothetical protein
MEVASLLEHQNREDTSHSNITRKLDIHSIQDLGVYGQERYYSRCRYSRPQPTGPTAGSGYLVRFSGL